MQRAMQLLFVCSLINSCLRPILLAYRSICCYTQLPDRTTAYRKQLHTRLRRNRIATGKFAKRGQDGAPCFKYKARQTQAVTRWALQLHGRMLVACQHGLGGVQLRVVAGRERPDQIRLIDHFDIEFGRRIACSGVVVAAYQCAVQAGVALSPDFKLTENRSCTGLEGMQKVAQKNQFCWLVAGDQLAQPTQVFKRRAAWHGLAERAVSRGFAQMQVGNEQHPPFWPPQRVLWQ